MVLKEGLTRHCSAIAVFMPELLEAEGNSGSMQSVGGPQKLEVPGRASRQHAALQGAAATEAEAAVRGILGFLGQERAGDAHGLWQHPHR